MPFVYRGPDALGNSAIRGEFQHAKYISLGNDLENLALVIGLLRDLVSAELGSF
jgi:hypothetical protein